MKIQDIMTRPVESCHPDTNLGDAALVMWRNDCGIVPVVERGTMRVVGVVTDRDICMALATTGRHPGERTVGEIMSRNVATVNTMADCHVALATMKRVQVRRLPVVNDDGLLVGVVSLNDLVAHAARPGDHGRGVLTATEIVDALAAIGAHRVPIVRQEEGAKPELVVAVR